MSIVFYIFCLCIFLVELPIIYTPLYYISYKVFYIDKKIKDGILTTILVAATIVLAAILFPFFLGIVRKWFI